MLKTPLKISQRLLSLNIISNNVVILYRTFNTIENNIAMSDCFLQSSITKIIMTKLARWKSAQSSCEKDNISLKERQECIKDYQQSAEFRQKMRRSNDCKASAKCCQNFRSDLLNHKEYYRSIESICPVYSEKPVPYSNKQECELDNHVFSSTRIMSKNWISRKLATQGKIYHKCKPKLCTFSHLTKRKEICLSSRTPRDCRENKMKNIRGHKLKQNVTIFSTQHCSKPKVESSLEPIKTLREKEISAVKIKVPKTYSAPDIYDDQIKLNLSANFSISPGLANKTEMKVQKFQTPTRNGRYFIEKPEEKLVMSDIRDCKHELARFDYRSSKNSYKEMWSIIVNRNSFEDVQERQKASLSRGRRTKKLKSRQKETTRKNKKRINLRSGWLRQKYKIRLKIFRKRNGRDPGLPQIVELIQPRGKMRSFPPKVPRRKANLRLN
ncbi:uncharacterized protein LOC109853367 [Pseudomyrmex gracilis]|uniref:uncharacterized protein LOC109853367 n=1 Tax=Pseudomyrmex gracilis TaxID=219809 RepID=UPI000995197C|nr:uncharacterized protein LOC109853367 [Pseudomyrmex gracilis]